MSDFPRAESVQYIAPNLGTSSAWSFGGTAIGMSLAAPATAVWPSANLALFCPFTLPCPFLVRAGWCSNGAVAGNIDIGVYGQDGSLIVSKGATAMAGANVPQVLTLTETLLSPGAYYLALSCSSTSATFLRNVYTGAVPAGGWLQAASQNPLTTLPTFASAFSTAYQPIFGISSNTTV